MDRPRAYDRRDLFCLALLLIIPAIFFADVLFTGSNFYYRDLFIYHFPMKRIVRDAMLSGEFPFWNPWYGNGQPIAANPAYELFYPPQWLILIGSYPFGFALHIIFHVFVALAGTYLLLRELPLGRAASLFGALSFGMGGLLLGSMPLLPTFFVWSLAPFVGWSVLRAIRLPSPARVAAAALLGGAQFVIAEPVALAQVWLLVGCGALLARGRRAMATLSVVIVLALLVASVQLVPAVDHARHSARSRGLSYSLVREFAMPPARPLELVVPHLFGLFDPFAGAFWGSAAFDRTVPYLFSIYNGIGVAILAIAGFLLRARGAATVALLTALSYVLAVGDRTPLLRALYSAGIARGIRYPEKFAALAVVAITIFAATIAERLLSGDERARRAALIAAALVLAISAVPVLWSLSPGFPSSFTTFWHRQNARLAVVARTQWLLGLVIAACAAAAIALLGRLEIRRWCAVAFAVVLLDLVLVGNDLVTRMPAAFFTPPDVVKSFDPDARAYALMHRGEWSSNTASYRQLRDSFGPWFARNGLQPFTPAIWGLRSALELDFDETSLLPTHDLLDAMMALGNSGYARWAESFAAISNVRYLLDYRPFALAAQSPDAAHARLVRLTKLPSTGRYYFPDQLLEAHSGDDVVTAIRNGGLTRPTAFVPFAPFPRSPARVMSVREHANGAAIDVETTADAFLVMTVTRDRNWRATLDGHPAQLLPANLAYQGVIVPAGRHRVEIRYRNDVVIGSAAVSLAAIAGCVIALIRPRRRLRNGS